MRPVKISKYGTAMAAMHDLPANKWHRTLDRYFHEYVEAPELAREAPSRWPPERRHTGAQSSTSRDT